MVRNTNGGNKSKGVARKHLVGAKEPRALRLASCSLEKYGAVSRVLGNGMFYVATDEHPQLLGRIRNKFKGRSKRDNMISLGAVVLIGLRDWEHPNYKECDLLEVYDANEIRQLMKIPSIDFSELQKHIDLNSSATNDANAAAASIGCSDVVFEEDRDYMEGLLPDENDTDAAIPIGSNEKSEIVDIDDI
jgi:translation initiation factor IF-1